MGNPIMEMLTRNNPTITGISQMIGIIKAASNPQAAFNQMAQNNPQIQQVMNYVNQNGGDPKQAFYNACKESGVDPDSILNQLR